MNVSLRRASRPWCGAITSLVGLIPFRRHYALLLNRGRVEPGLHPAERAGLSNSLFAEHGLPREARQTVLSKETVGRWLRLVHRLAGLYRIRKIPVLRGRRRWHDQFIISDPSILILI